tara:strand:+ start:1138 stop:1659 length:522 start_codon:yes stop_codon:yes gene_type:complete
MGIDDKFKNKWDKEWMKPTTVNDSPRSNYDILNDPFDDLYTSPIDWKSLDTRSKKTDEGLKQLREKQNLNDRVTKETVKPYIRRVAKSLDNPISSNPNLLWNVKRENHKLLKTEVNPKMREKLTQEIIEADEMLLKNIDEETRWLTEEQNKIRGKLTSNNTKGQTNVRPKPIK